MKVAAYCRVSTELDDQQNSLKNQQEYFSRYIQEQKEDNWEFAGVYADEGISGTSIAKRDAFLKMMSDAKAGKMDLILTKEVSRFARNTVDTLMAIRNLKSYGVGVFFIIDHIDTRDNDGEIRLTLMASMAQEESRKTSERVKWGQKRQMEKGIVFGKRLLGYTLSDGILVTDPREADLVRDIFFRFGVQGKGTGVIAQELNAENKRTIQGNPFTNVAIRRILMNEKYVGDLIQKKTYTPDYLSHKKKVSPKDELIIIKNHHDPIVTRNLYDLVQKRLAEERIKDYKKYQNRYWCSGKVVCAICGSTYVSRVRKKADGSVTQTWACGSMTKRKQKCNGKRVHDVFLQRGFKEVLMRQQLLNKENQEEINSELTDLSNLFLSKILVEEQGVNYILKNGRTETYTYKDRYRRTSTS